MTAMPSKPVDESPALAARDKNFAGLSLLIAEV
jgi:hypothetical protein